MSNWIILAIVTVVFYQFKCYINKVFNENVNGVMIINPNTRMYHNEEGDIFFHYGIVRKVKYLYTVSWYNVAVCEEKIYTMSMLNNKVRAYDSFELLCRNQYG